MSKKYNSVLVVDDSEAEQLMMMRMLEALITRSGRAVSKEKLFDEVFALADDVNLDAIELYIHRVRKKLENGVEAGSPDGAVITTLRGIGYLLQPRSAMAPATPK